MEISDDVKGLFCALESSRFESGLVQAARKGVHGSSHLGCFNGASLSWRKHVSGIVGMFWRDGRPVDNSALARMLQAMHYRGPDGSTTWSEGALGLGHLMLRSTPESREEKLPKSNMTNRLIITADARIDNRDELLAGLAVTTGGRQAVDDSDLILLAHQRWGEGAPEKLIGDFAYCIWDRFEKALFCCRDAFGVRPLYYYLSEKIFAFASEIRPLMELDEVPRRLNEVMVADYLIGMEDDQAITFYKGIFRLPPAHFIIVGPSRVRICRYWSPDLSQELRLSSDEEYAQAFRDLFVEAVRCRLRSAYPVATTLSGGLDSSSVTCVARDLLRAEKNEPLRTLSMVYDQVQECDEREFIDVVVAQGGVEPFYLPSDRATPLPYFGLTSHDDHDDPFDAPNSFLISGLAKLSDLKIRVALDGFDGDNTVSHGYAYWPELAYKGKVVTMLREVRALSKRQNRSFLDLLWRKAVRPLTPARVRTTWRLLGGYGNRPWPKHSLISLEFAERTGLAERYREVCSYYLKPLHDAREDHCHSLLSGGLTHHLESTNKILARFSIEPRHPFFDRRLVEFCLVIPHVQKISNGWTRLVFRRAMAGILPEEIRWRVGKLDFRPAFNYAILNVDRALLARMFLDCSKALESYVDRQALSRTYSDFLSDPLGQDPTYLFVALCLGLWLRRCSLSC
jgi:asparagine synthase (glutamine-hydrolysing)